MSSTALILIDIQEFYFLGGALPLLEPEKAALNAQKILNTFRDHNLKIVHIKHIANSGSNIHKLVSPINDEKVIEKNKANAFVDRDLLDFLKENNITNLILWNANSHVS